MRRLSAVARAGLFIEEASGGVEIERGLRDGLVRPAPSYDGSRTSGSIPSIFFSRRVRRGRFQLPARRVVGHEPRASAEVAKLAEPAPAVEGRRRAGQIRSNRLDRAM